MKHTENHKNYLLCNILHIVKQKILQVKRSTYGDLYGIVNGKFRYQSSSDTLDLSKIRGHVNIHLESHYGIVVLKLPDEDFSTTSTTGWWDFENKYYPYFPKLKTNFLTIGHFAKNHWKEGLTIGSVVWTFFKEIGILAVPLNKFYRI